MKHILLVILLLGAGTSAFAKDMSAAEFSKEFILRMNARLKVVNAERVQENKKPLCSSLNQKQIRLIEKSVAVKEITVGQFVKDVGQNIKCYPVFWEPWGQKNIGGMAFNTKAWVLDTMVLRDVIEEMASGRYVHDNEVLLEFANAW